MPFIETRTNVTVTKEKEKELKEQGQTFSQKLKRVLRADCS